MQQIFKKEIAETAIQVCLESIGPDLLIKITGGDLPHIGSITIINKNMEYKTLLFDEHREDVVSEMFCQGLKEVIEGNLCVLAGIHIDDITKEQIQTVLMLCKELLEEVKEYLYESKN